jgi:hypothetical protein
MGDVDKGQIMMRDIQYAQRHIQPEHRAQANGRINGYRSNACAHQGRELLELKIVDENHNGFRPPVRGAPHRHCHSSSDSCPASQQTAHPQHEGTHKAPAHSHTHCCLARTRECSICVWDTLVVLLDDIVDLVRDPDRYIAR